MRGEYQQLHGFSAMGGRVMSKTKKEFCVWLETEGSNVRTWYRGYNYWLARSDKARLFNERGARRMMNKLDKAHGFCGDPVACYGFMSLDAMKAASYSTPEELQS